MFTLPTILAIAATGLVTGTLGGMLGVGGSVIMIPVLVLLFGQDAHPGFNQHLYQAAAMLVNVAVVLPALRRHHQAGGVSFRALRLILPAALVCVILGVMLSNAPIFAGSGGAVWLGRVLTVFLVYVIYVNIRRLLDVQREPQVPHTSHITWPRAAGVGVAMGTTAGLMGIGGGAIAVPLQQMLMRLPLRHAISNSCAIICITALVGGIYKNATLASHGLAWTDSLKIAGLLAPTALVGGYIGGKLTHLLPVGLVRAMFIVLMIVAAWKMAAIPWSTFALLAWE
jgi:uncharacterized membrane protein YfcA